MVRQRYFARSSRGRSIYYEVGGQTTGVPLVLIRGLARSSSYWLEFRDILERTRPVLVLDNRGVGRSDSVLPGFSTADMADDVGAVLKHAGFALVDIFGISMGGMIAQWVALRYAQQVRRLVLTATTPGQVHGKRPAVDSTVELLRAFGRPYADAIQESAPLLLSSSFLRRRPEIPAIWTSIAASEPKSRVGVIGQLLAASRHDAYARLPWIEQPTLVITGDQDRLVPHENSQILKRRIPRAALHIFPGVGHDVPTEKPEACAQLMMEFLDAEVI